MQRTRPTKIPSAILTADWHLSETAPLCRLDQDWPDTMRRKLEFIKQLQAKHNIPVLHAGDLFDHWKPSPWLISFAIKHLPKNFHTILGNHDLPQHNLELYPKTGVATLETGGHLTVIAKGGHWGTPFSSMVMNIERLIIIHIMTYQGRKPWPDCPDPSALELLKQADPDVKLILTGHDHKSFTEEYKGKWLVNPGSIFRLTADQTEHRPSIFLWYKSENQIEQVYLPIQPKMVSREHIEVKAERDERIQRFIERLKNDFKPSVSLEENLRTAFAKNNTPKSIQQIIWNALDGGTNG